MDLRFEEAEEEDFEVLVELRVEAMRESLERIGRFDRGRSVERFRKAFCPEETVKVFVGDELVGFYAVDNQGDCLYLDHLYIDPKWQSRGIGGVLIERVIRESEKVGLPLRLGALKESRSNEFYRKWGFEVIGEGDWDLYYERVLR